MVAKPTATLASSETDTSGEVGLFGIWWAGNPHRGKYT
jgi:hypothetical protein